MRHKSLEEYCEQYSDILEKAWRRYRSLEKRGHPAAFSASCRWSVLFFRFADAKARKAVSLGR